jgi:RNA polymerase sigma factor (sigma-70 family)
MEGKVMVLNKLNDEQLVKLYINGNEDAFEVLLKNHKRKIYGYIYKMVKDSELAEDLFQDTFIKVIHTLKQDKYNEEGKFLPWVMRIAHNLIIDYFRKANRMPMAGRKKRSGVDDDDFDIFRNIKISDKNIQDHIIEEQILNDVKKLIEYLPADQKEVLVMRHYQDMSFKDIAETTGISINTALGRMRYALINLRKLVKDHNIELTLN